MVCKKKSIDFGVALVRLPCFGPFNLIGYEEHVSISIVFAQ